MLALPAVITLVVFFFVPLCLLLAISFSGETPLAAYRQFFASAAAIKILGNTAAIAAFVTVCCLLIALPFALCLRNLSGRYKRLALLGVTLPMWISILVRSYAWLYLLSREGVINSGLMALGWIGAPVPLLFNWFAVGIGMVHILLPYMLLPIHNAVEALDPQLIRAARSLGASRARVLCTIVMPLISRGLATGAVLVFILALGFYVTPQMLGGPRNMMLATYIDVMVNTTLDWKRAAAASTILMLGVISFFGLLSLLTDRRGARSAA
jgi:mannopine transport system permease protein